MLLATWRSRTSTLGLLLIAVLTVAGCSGSDTASGTPPPTTAEETVASDPASSDTTSSSPGGSQECEQSGQMATVAYRSLDGVAPNLTSLDVHPVAGRCHAPVVLWVHGGGYRKGDKANQIDDKVTLFNDLGWVLVSVNYRLTNPGQAGSAQYPDHFDDVAAAVAWTQSNIVSFGGDPSRLALLGHSAGADIVSNVATNPIYLEQHDLDLSVLRCAGPLDTEGFDKVTAGADDPGGEEEQWKLALGNNPNYLTETSATRLVRSGIDTPAMIGVVRGSPRRQDIESAFLAALDASDIGATTIDARKLTHNEVNTRIGAPDDDVMTGPLVDFLTACWRE